MISLNNTNLTIVLPDDAFYGKGLMFVSMLSFGVMVVSAVVNSLIILVFTESTCLHNSSTILLVNMAFGDLVYHVHGFPSFTTTAIFPTLYCHSVVLKVKGLILHFLLHLAFHNVQIAAQDWYIGFHFPYKYGLLVDVKFSCALSITSITLTIFRVILYLSLLYIPTVNAKALFVTDIVIVVVSCVFTVIVYVRLHMESKKTFLAEKKIGIVNKESKAMTSLVTGFVYTISWLPGIAVSLGHRVLGNTGHLCTTQVLFIMMWICSKLSLYIYRMKAFRNALKSLFARRGHKQMTSFRVIDLGNSLNTGAV